MKKKVVALMMSAVMAFSLAASGDNTTQTSGSGSTDPNGGVLQSSSPVRANRKAHLSLHLRVRRMSRQFPQRLR